MKLSLLYLVKTEASELLTLLFSMKDEPESTPIPTKAAKAMCWNLVDAGLGFEKLHSVASQGREIGPSNHLESVMRQTFLAKISGFPADEVDQVIFSAIYTRIVARQYGICWPKKELSIVHGTIHIFSRIKLFWLSR